MKKIVLLLVMILLPSMCLADFDATSWKYYKDIQKDAGELSSFVVDDELFAGTQNDLRDLRIIDADGKEVAYKLMKNRFESNRDLITPRMINNTFKEGISSSVILDFGTNNQGVNRLKINTNAKNFQRTVKVSASHVNNKDFRVLSDNLYIYDYTDKRGNFTSRNTDISFSESAMRYLKIEISDEEGVPVKIASVTGYKYNVKNVKENIKSPEFKINHDERTNNLEVMIDLGASGLPTGKLLLDIMDENFNRGVKVYSSYDNRRWHSVGSGYIYRYKTSRYKGENLILNFKETNERYIKLEIINNDDQMLDVLGVKSFSVVREVVFKGKGSEGYKVFYGNTDARFPIYDIEKYFRYLDLSKSAVSNLGLEQKNSEYVMTDDDKGSEKEENYLLLSIGLILSSILLLGLVYGFLKK